ncbi:transposase family protein [Nocardia yunnanensis]|uniref:transposase family protein n=1 Tax=Nocardia yunnanensis TaxID=2382165 RepID=UPI001FE4EB6A|nr:transposase family protein [Nocardia yunnanensis]
MQSHGTRPVHRCAGCGGPPASAAREQLCRSRRRSGSRPSRRRGDLWVKQPSDGRDLDIDTRTRNALLRGLRCLAERGFALLTGRWRALRHFTTSPEKIGDIVKAALVLTHFEHGRHQ